VDTSVYTKNRAFRLFLSRKFGKTAALALTPASRSHLLSGTDTNTTFKEMVQKILLASFAAPLDALQRDEQSLLTVLDFDMDPQLHRLLPTVALQTPFQAAGSLSGSSNSPSPFSAIDRFIESIANKGGVQGHIRDWKYTVSKLAAGTKTVCDADVTKACAFVSRCFPPRCVTTDHVPDCPQPVVRQYQEAPQEQPHPVRGGPDLRGLFSEVHGP
jgi:hypothetical protein